jgi:hypothetical protein
MEKLNGIDTIGAPIIRSSNMNENNLVSGKYSTKCFDKDGNLKWEETFDNLVTDVGANFLLNQAFGAAQNTTYFLGLISSVGFTSVLNAHIMSSHSTWNEAGNGVNYPVWTTPASNARVAVTWSAAGSRIKALSATANFTIGATGGTVQGCFIVTGTGAVATNNDTNGTLYSCGTFGTPKVVTPADVLQVTYSTSV